ncbi:hypothetical protein ABXS71_19920 [Bacillus infantis]|uniref:hypothetical protein n=1 Tax=Bacillus infantis TaxID=324767 RepID=UPI00301A2B30
MKKIYAIIFTALFLASAGAFYMEGAPLDATASDKKADEVQSEKQEETADPSPQAEETATVETEPSKDKEEPLQDLSENENGASQEPSEESEAASTQTQNQDTIKIEDVVYVNIMDSEKFAHMSRTAAKYGAKLYALPNSDLFVIAKDGKPIVYMSTGVKTASVAYADLMAELFTEGFSEYKKLPENILFSAETGAEVSVDFGDYIAYGIETKEGWIKVSW